MVRQAFFPVSFIEHNSGRLGLVSVDLIDHKNGWYRPSLRLSLWDQLRSFKIPFWSLLSSRVSNFQSIFLSIQSTHLTQLFHCTFQSIVLNLARSISSSWMVESYLRLGCCDSEHCTYTWKFVHNSAFCPFHSSTGSGAREHDQRYTLDKADGNKSQWFPNELGMAITYIHMAPFQIHKAIEWLMSLIFSTVGSTCGTANRHQNLTAK